MSQDLTEVVQPLVEKGQFENAESAVRDLMTEYILRQIERYRKIVKKYEKKYGMRYHQFVQYLKERASKLSGDISSHQKFMKEEDDALEWKIAIEMLESWMGLKTNTSHEQAQ